MSEGRIHRAISDDGTEIAGRVSGHGPPLVLVHGSLEDGDLNWDPMLPHLKDRFTCFLMSTRGRGPSGGADDLAPGRRLEDVTAFIDSIGEPVCLAGESDGGALALGAAARTGAISALAVYEPVVTEMVDDEIEARLEDTIARVSEAAAEGRLTQAARAFGELVANEDELMALSASGYFNECARYIPVMLQELQREFESGDPSPTDPSALANITVPVLLLSGSHSALHFLSTDGVRYISEHLPGSRIREVAYAGHFGVALAPGAIAGELIPFFTTALRSI